MKDKKLYFCNQCKKTVNSLDDLYFVEDNTARGFCSEECIENFYTNIISYFDGNNKSYRQVLNLANEQCLSVIKNPIYIEKCLENPSEVWIDKNDLNEEIYTYITLCDDPEFGQIWLISICLSYRNEASFVFLFTATSSYKLVQEFQRGEKKVIVPDKNFTSEDLQLFESKKNIFLSLLLEKRLASDIPFENFGDYDFCLKTTMELPDEVYQERDIENDQVYKYIKSYEKDEVSFYYIVICVLFNGQKSPTLFPVLSFPTIDAELYNTLKSGEQISGGLKS